MGSSDTQPIFCCPRRDIVKEEEKKTSEPEEETMATKGLVVRHLCTPCIEYCEDNMNRGGTGLPIILLCLSDLCHCSSV